MINTDYDFEKAINQCRTALGNAPREFSIYRGWKNKMPKPFWLLFENDQCYNEILSQQDSLLKRGNIIWGGVIQANSALFSKGSFNHPAAVIYSFDCNVDKSPEIIKIIASELFSYKGMQTSNPEIQAFSDKLADEIETDLKLKIPEELTEGVECFYTSILVHRNHLPNNVLSMGVFHLLVNPEETEATMILPFKYWPKSLINLWCAA